MGDYAKACEIYDSILEDYGMEKVFGVHSQQPTEPESAEEPAEATASESNAATAAEESSSTTPAAE